MNDTNKIWAMIVGGTNGIGYAVARELLESNISNRKYRVHVGEASH